MAITLRFEASRFCAEHRDLAAPSGVTHLTASIYVHGFYEFHLVVTGSNPRGDVGQFETMTRNIEDAGKAAVEAIERIVREGFRPEECRQEEVAHAAHA